MQDLCALMGVSRSGYYKWKKREKSDRDMKREEMIALVDAIHAKHRSHGYRWTAAYIRLEYGYECSDNYIYKCYRYLGIKAETKHQVHYRKRKEKDKYPNLIFTTWDTIDRPRQVIVSDMTAFKFWILYFEVTFYFDVFTKEILTYKVAARKGDRQQYIDFKIDECRRREEFEAVLEQYVDFYNKHRPCYAIGYDTPVNYRKRYYKGELERKNTFENRVLSEEPKFVQKRRKQAHSGNVSTFRNENE